MAKKSAPTEQQSLFGEVQLRSLKSGTPRAAAPRIERRAEDAQAEARKEARPESPRRNWNMPTPSGSTVAEVRLRWNRRLTPAQVARVESELGALPRLLGKLGFGAVVVERAFVRRRQKG